MRSALRCLILTTLCAAVLSGRVDVALAQQTPDDDDRGQADRSRSYDRDDWGDERTDTHRIRRREEIPTPELIAKLNKLLEELKERVELTDDQEERIDDLFEFQIEGLEAAAAKRRSAEDEERDVEDLRALREELIEARKAGDRERARELRKQMNQKLRQRRTGGAEATPRFIEHVASFLEEEQRSPFLVLVKRLELPTAEPRRQHPVQMLMRAVMSSEVGLTTEQRRDVRMLMREHMTDAKRRRADKDETDKAFTELRGAVFELLSNEQCQKVEARLAALEEDKERSRGKGRLGKPRRERDRAEEPDDYDDESDDDEGLDDDEEGDEDDE